MELYLAGNFVIMGDPVKEKYLQERTKPCFRLGAFFYKKQLAILLKVKEEELNGNKKIRIQKACSEGRSETTKNTNTDSASEEKRSKKTYTWKRNK